MEALRNVLNIRDISIRNLNIDEAQILANAFALAGFTAAKSAALKKAWEAFRQERLNDRIDRVYSDFISKTVFNMLNSKKMRFELDGTAFAWIGSKAEKQCVNNTLGRPKSLDKLDKMVGLHAMKRELENIFSHTVISRMKFDAGLTVELPNLNFLFTGNPGTGKTTVAYLIAEFFKEIGILPSGHLVTASRGTLIAQYLGQTAPLVTETFMSALGGVLFVDEAYSLYQADSSLDSYGKEAINTLTLLMTEYRGRIAVIFAGYPDEMAYMLDSVNPGLKERFAYKLNFEDYSKEDLLLIFNGKIEDAGMLVQKEGIAAIKKIISDIWSKRDKQFANGRVVENIIQMLIAEQEKRLAQQKFSGKKISTESLRTIITQDCDALLTNPALMGTGNTKSSIGFCCALE